MKLNHFKFQDGKVFWLPEYPEKPKDYRNSPEEEIIWDDIRDYEEAVAKSLASAIEVAPEDREKVKRLVYDSIHPPILSVAGIKTTFVGDNVWQPEKDKVYSAECEMEIKLTCNNLLKPPHMEQKCDCDVICLSPKKVSRLKPALETVKP